MPNDLVSREAVLKALRARGRELLKLGTSFESNIASVTALECVNIVKDAPAVDAAPVVHGELRSTGFDELYCEWGDCSECGADNRISAKFCNNCGARLDGKDGVK